MSICLNMIVRNEASVICRCLRSVIPFIDCWVIVDTGSDDDTPNLIRECLKGIPGNLYHRDWKNFGHNRTEALELAKTKADYILFIDADEQLYSQPKATLPNLTGPAYSFETKFGELSYDRVSLVSTKYPWRWEGVLHEYLTCGQPVAQPRVQDFWICVTTDGARSKDPLKFQKDAQILLAALKEEPNNERYVFYLAQSYRDCGELDLAYKYYLQRASMEGWAEETWYSLYQCARLSEYLKHPHEEILKYYLAAYEYRPTRAESLTALSAYCRGRQDWSIGYLMARRAVQISQPDDRLFVDLSVYEWRAADELALAAYYTDHREEARTIWRGLLKSQAIPTEQRDRIRKNLEFV